MLKSTKFYNVFVWFLTVAVTMADKQILILVEPTNFEKNATKSQTATWQFGTDFQKKSLQKVLQSVVLKVEEKF